MMVQLEDKNITILPSDNNTIFLPEVDIVYTWVNGSDPKHKQGKNRIFIL